jgi:hypothetical protein
MDEVARTDATLIAFSKAFDRVPHDMLLTKMATTGVVLRVVEWVKEFLLGRSQGVSVDGKLSEEVRVTSGVFYTPHTLYLKSAATKKATDYFKLFKFNYNVYDNFLSSDFNR